MSERLPSIAFPALLLAASVALASSTGLSAAPAERAADEAQDAQAKTATPKPVRHADGSTSIAVVPSRQGLYASVGEDGRIRIACFDGEHALLDKKAHQRLHDELAGMAWE